MRNDYRLKHMYFAVIVMVVIALLALPGCAWIEEFDAQGREVEIDAFHDVKPIRVAWINSYTEDNVWSGRLQIGMLETLARNGYSRPSQTLEWQVFHLNAQEDNSYALLRYKAEYLIPDVLDYNPDIIIVSDDEASLAFAPIYPNYDVPIIYCGVTTDLQVTGLNRPNIAGITEPIYALETLAIARTMTPMHRRNLVIADGSLTGKASANSVVAQLAGSTRNEQPPILEVVRDWEEWKAVIRQYTYDVDLIFLASHQPLRDRNGNLVSEERILNWTLYNSWAPVFSFTQTAVANGAVAGLVTDAYDQGRSAAEMVIYLANDGDISMIESQLNLETTNRLVLNLDAARRWSLDVPVMFPIVADIQGQTQQPGGGQ